jgi:hypothetical protein
MKAIKRQKLNATQAKKVQKDLTFIHSITHHAKQKNVRIVVSGGYAVDGHLGDITRYHSDIDLQIYAKEPLGLPLVEELVRTIGYNLPIIDRGRQEFYHEYEIKQPDLSVNIYYLLCVTHPFESRKMLVKKDGTYSPVHPFETSPVAIGSYRYEAVTPLGEIIDKLYKREYRNEPKLKKHDHDIHNLRQITDDAVVKEFFSSFSGD